MKVNWIKVEDKLPENDTHVLVHCKGISYPFVCHFTVVRVSWHSSTEFFNCFSAADEHLFICPDHYIDAVIEDSFHSKDVTHWQPLPELPKN